MSTIRANAILDSAGGNTATINGITPALASQAEAQAGVNNTKLMTPLRVSEAITSLTPAPTTTQILNATAGLSAGAVGSYAMAYVAFVTSFGSLVGGSSLIPSSGTGSNGGGALTGTWRSLGYASGGGEGNLWLRIS